MIAAITALFSTLSLANSQFKPPSVAEIVRENARSSVLAHIHDTIFSGFDWSGTTPTRTALMLIVVALIMSADLTKRRGFRNSDRKPRTVRSRAVRLGALP